MSDQLILGTRKGLFQLQKKSRRWQITNVSFEGVAITMVLADASRKAIYAAAGHGHFGVKMQKSTDGGASWTEIESPAYPPLPEGAEPDKCPMRGIEIPRRLDMVWAMEFASPSDTAGDALWLGSLPGGLFRSGDGGASWQFNQTLWDEPDRKKWMGGGYDYPGIHSVCVDPRDERKVTLGISCGGIWKTDDAGANWALHGQGLRADYMPPDQAEDVATQDAHRLVQCPGQPEHAWIQHHNGIFKSSDTGSTWTEVHEAGPSVFGFAVAVHPTDGQAAWFVPAKKDEYRVPVDGKFVVTRTRDAGATFDVLTDGLPQENAYDIVFRHALDVDNTGQQLAVGSTTGSLWTTENAGDSWSTISANLPPIYCLRFLK